MKKILLLAIIILNVTLSLTGCGFHLRGATQLAPPLQRVYIKTATPYSELTRNLHEYFTLSGARIVNNSDEANTVLVILSEQETQQLIGIDSAQQTRQYNLSLTVNFQLTDKNGVPLTPINTLIQTRPLPINSAEVVTSSNQAIILYKQMRREIVFAIMNRVSSEEITTLLTKKKKTLR